VKARQFPVKARESTGGSDPLYYSFILISHAWSAHLPTSRLNVEPAFSHEDPALLAIEWREWFALSCWWSREAQRKDLKSNRVNQAFGGTKQKSLPAHY
jgi:hypothetical protein